MSVKENQLTTEVLVIGGGPGGYSAAFRAADLGKKVTLVEKFPVLGGVCLNVGCIPSKALLHVAHILSESKEIASSGVSFQDPDIDREKLVKWKGSVTSQLTTGLAALAKQRKVTVLQGIARFSGAHEVIIDNEGSGHTVKFDNVIIAVGSQPVKIPSFPNDDERLMDSTGALELSDIPSKLLIVGGGIIGLEMATVYHALGSQITIVEMMDQLIPGCDKDLVRPLAQKVKKQYDNIFLSTKVTEIVSQEDGLQVTFDKQGTVDSDLFDKVLVAVGRRPNGHLIDADKAGVVVTERGFIEVDKQMRTNVEHIFAIGDVVGNPMLAHKAVHEGKIAAEVIAGERVEWQALTIPSVAYTDPEVAWMGLTEIEAKAQGIAYEKAAFPWAASGRSLSIGRKEGLTKLITDKATKQILGAGIVGTNAGELIGEAVLALEMGACAEDVALTVHPHPTLSETLGFSAEMIEGTITDLLVKKR